jgi:hypothetical protein
MAARRHPTFIAKPKGKSMHSLLSSPTYLLAAVLALPAGAGAAERWPAASAPPPQSQAGLTSSAAFDADADAVDDKLLARARGGSDQTLIDTRLTGAVAGNTATNVTTGSNVIQGGSFANMSGIPIVVQNSGANVLIQNATVINLQMK